MYALRGDAILKDTTNAGRMELVEGYASRKRGEERAVPADTIMWKVSVSLSVRGRLHYWSMRGAVLLPPLITTGAPHASVVITPAMSTATSHRSR